VSGNRFVLHESGDLEIQVVLSSCSIQASMNIVDVLINAISAHHIGTSYHSL